MQRVWWKYEGWHLVFYIPGGINILSWRSAAKPVLNLIGEPEIQSLYFCILLDSCRSLYPSGTSTSFITQLVYC